jgi:succinoglycan biosynthesis transport protein ExoP
MHKNSLGRTLDLSQVLQVVRRRGLLVLLCFGVAAVAAFAVSKHERKQYTAAASILFRNEQLDQQAAGLSSAPVSNPQAQTDTNIKLASLPSIAGATASALGHGQTVASVSNAVTVGPESDTSLASVSATAPSPSMAAKLANEYAVQAIAYRQQADGGYYAHALRAVALQFQALTPSQQRGVQGIDLQDRISSLQILSQLQGQEVQLAQAASPPTSPSSPKTSRNTVLGAILGLVLGLALAYAAERFDRLLREPSDVETAYGVPLLSVVPNSNALKAEGKDRNGNVTLPAEEAELFSLLRAHVRYFNIDHELRLVAVVSAAAGDGKTTIARNLVLATASTGARVLFIEADLRRPSAAKHFGVDSTVGIVDVLTGQVMLRDAVQTVQFTDRGGQDVAVDVLLAAGVLPPNPVQALESQAMATLLEQAKSTYDLVVVDTPPMSLVSDAFPVLRAADGVLIVSRLGRNRRDIAMRLRETLESANASVIGVVANGYRPRDGASYGYEHSEYVTDKVAQPSHRDGEQTNAVVAGSERVEEERPPEENGLPGVTAQRSGNP